MFYNGDKIIEKGKLINFILGARGWGKTYYFKKRSIEDCIKSGEQFIYLRRFKEEVTVTKDKLFGDILIQFPEYEIKLEKDTYFINKKGEKHSKILGYIIPLSTSSKYKSVPFPYVTKIIFDEFIVDKGVLHYLPNEVQLFLEFCSTVIRNRNNVQVFLLGNAISLYNPYTLYFKIKLQQGQKLYQNGEILLEMNHNREYEENMKSTRFGKLINGSKYGEYAIENKFLKDDKTFIEKKYSDSKDLCTYIFNNKEFSVWYSIKHNMIHISKDKSNKQIRYTFTTDEHNPTTYLIRSFSKDRIWRQIKEMYQEGNVRFENGDCKNSFMEAMAMVNGIK